RIGRLAGVDAGDRVLEVDPRLARVLEDVVAGDDGVRVVTGDALTVDLGALLGAEPWWCVSNLPYNVATPVVIRLLEEAPSVQRALVMVQREVADRLVASPGSSAYGAPSVRVAYDAEARLVGTVPRAVFFPVPK